MNSKPWFSSSDPLDYSFPPFTPSEEHDPLSSPPNTDLPISNLGIDTNTGNMNVGTGTMSNFGTDTNTGNMGVGDGTMSNFGIDTNTGNMGVGTGIMSNFEVDTNTGNMSVGAGIMSNLGADTNTSSMSVGGSAGASGSKPRGRPPGAKNKANKDAIPVPPQVKTVLLQIPPGTDVIACVSQFAQARNASVHVLSGFGMISQVIYSHMSAQQPAIISEPLNLISLAGLVTPTEASVSSFTATLARLNGGLYGVQALKLVTMQTVVLTVLVSQGTEVYNTTA